MAVPVVALSTALIREAQAISLPMSLIEATVGAATRVAAGASAASALSAPVASLSEGVLNAMLFAKVKGIAIGVGLMTAVVSGAVVLAESGPAPKPVAVPVDPTQPMAEYLGSNVPPQSAEGDRTAALEKKLDRVLEALERMSMKPQAPETVTQPVRMLPKSPPTAAGPIC